MRNRINATLAIALIGVLGLSMFIMAAADTRVADAAMNNDIEAVRSLLKQAADANSSQGDGMTALHWAATHGNAEMAQLLIYAGATVKSATRIAGFTPLYLAAQYGNAKVVDVLLRAGADAKTATLAGITPLMMAASSGDADTIKALLEQGAEVDAKDPTSGQTALIFAAAFDRAEAIRILARYGAKLDHKSNLITRVYSNLGDRNAAPPPPAPAAPAAGAAAGAPVGPRGQGGRGAAAATPPVPVPVPGIAPPPPVQPVPQQGMGGRGAAPRDPTRAGGNPKGQLTPLMYAARQGNLAATTALIESGAKLNEVSADGSTAVLLAAINGNFDTVKLLAERGADVNIPSMDGTGPLYAVLNMQWARKTLHPQPTTKYEKTHYLDLAKLLLDKGSDPNARLKKDLWYDGFGFGLDGTNAAGATPFWRCADAGDVDGMRLLLSRGASATIGNVDNVTPLLVASGAGFHGNDDIVTPMGRMAAVRYLVDELHADVNVVDGRPDPAATEVPAALPAAGQQPVVPPMNFGRTGGGYTALHNAAARGDNEMILFLISRGAKIDAVSKNGNTVADMANGPRQRVQPRPETIALLEALGAKNSYKCVSC